MKRGQAEMLEWIPRLLMLFVAVLVIALLVNYFSDRDIDATEIHTASYFYRIYYDGNLVMHADKDTGRAYPGVVAVEKFTESRLDDLYGEAPISSKLTLTSTCSGEKIIYHNQRMYDERIPFARFGTTGAGSATVTEHVIPVTVRSGVGSCPGWLNVTIVRPNS